MRVLLDVGPGCDDALALCAALGHPDIDVATVTTVAGNADAVVGVGPPTNSGSRSLSIRRYRSGPTSA